MPRLPLPTQFALEQRAPARFISACRPRISATATHRSLFCHLRSFSSSPSPRLIATPIRCDRYTPERLPNAAWPYLYHPPNKMAHLDPYFKQVDALQSNFIERLREAVAIPSIGSEDQRRPDVVKVRINYKARMHCPVSQLTQHTDGPLVSGPDQGAWWYR